MNVSNNLIAPCLLIFVMLALILFQSVFFKSDAVIFNDDMIVNSDISDRPDNPDSQDNQDISGANSGKYIIYNDIRYQPDKFFILVIISHICVFLLPAVFYIKIRGEGYSKKLKLDLPKPRYISLAAFMFFALIFGTVLINSLIYYISGFSIAIGGTLINTGGNPIYDMGVLISFVFLPAVCEEFMFRSVLSAEYEKYGALCAAIITSVAFAMSHFSLLLFPSYFFSAVIFYGLAKVTNCVVFPAILHAGYNIFNIYVWDKLAGVLKFEQNRFIFIFVIAVVFMFFVYLVFGRLESIYYYKAYANRINKINEVVAENPQTRRMRNIRNLKKAKNIKNRGIVSEKNNINNTNNIGIIDITDGGGNFFIKFFRSFLSPTFIGAIIIFFVYIIAN